MSSLRTELMRFEVYVGGFMGPSYSVEKDDDVLLYKTYGDGYSLEKTQRIEPSPQEWKRFFDVCDQIGIWEWQERYENPQIMDGFSWRVVVELGGKRLDTSGSNEGPDNLDVLLGSVSELLGGAVFR